MSARTSPPTRQIRISISLLPSLLILQLLSLITVVKCLWTTPAVGDTFRFSVDVINNYVYFEKIGDTTGYYGISPGTNVSNLIYTCGFVEYGEIDYNIDPTMIGIQAIAGRLIVTGYSVISNQTMGVTAGPLTVGNVNVLSFQATFTGITPYNEICTGFYHNTDDYELCTTLSAVNFGYSSETYSSCGICDCTCNACFGPKATQCCATGCATCWGLTNSQCPSCSSGHYLQPGPSSTTCLSTCPSSGYYPNSVNNTCTSCSSECATCSGGSNTECLTCTIGYFLQPSPSSNTCESTCPTGYFGDSSNNTCVSCDPACATCSGGSNTECLTCTIGYFLQPSPSSNTCESTCPTGYFGDTSNNTCVSCHPACVTCTGSGTSSCPTCSSGYFLQPAPAINMCLATCPMWYSLNNFTQVCSCSAGNGSSCEFVTADKTASILQHSATSFSAASAALSSALTSSSSSSAIQSSSSTSHWNFLLCLTASESIANMQYLNINHSQLALAAYSGLSSSLVPNWISKANTIDSNELVFNYGIFEKIPVSSLYLDNYGDSLTEAMIYWGFCLLGYILSKCQNKEELLDSRTGKFYTITLGLFLNNIFGQIQSQILFSILQILKTNLLINTYSGTSYFVTYFTTNSLIGLQIFTFFKLKTIFANKKRQKTNQINSITGDDLNARWTEKRFESLFSSFKEDSENQLFFTYWMMVFDTIYILLILTLQSVPVLQSLSIFMLTLLFILFSAFVNPMKEKAAAFSFFFNFACILTIAGINMAQAIIEAVSKQAVDNYGFGMAILCATLINTGVNLIIGFAAIMFGFFLLLSRYLKSRSKNSKESAQAKELNKRESPREPNSQVSLNQKPDPVRTLTNYFLESSQIKEDGTTSNQQQRHSRAIKENGHSRRSTFSPALQVSLNRGSQKNDRSPSRAIEENGHSRRSTFSLPLQVSLNKGSQKNDRSPSRAIEENGHSGRNTFSPPWQVSLNRGSRKNDRSPSKRIRQDDRLNFSDN